MIMSIINKVVFSIFLLFIGFSIGDPQNGIKIFDTVIFGLYNNTVGLFASTY
jgi:hypothetical protein